MTEDTHAAGEDWEERLLAELVEAGQLEAVPVEAAAEVKAQFSLRTLDAELAELVYDSATAQDALAGVRGGAATVRLMTFESAGLTVEVEAQPTAGERWRLVGQLVPPGPGSVDVRYASGIVSVEADEVGRFSVDGIPAGPLSLRCHVAGSGGAVATDWLLL
jgi:hypothetical protein